MRQQLTQVDETLKNCKSDAERESLENLRCDLHELLELTRETLREQTGQLSNHCKKDDLSNDGEDGDIDDDPYAHEMALFMSEIKSCDEKTELTVEGTSKQCSIEDDAQQILFNKFKVSDSRFHRKRAHSMPAKTHRTLVVFPISHFRMK